MKTILRVLLKVDISNKQTPTTMSADISRVESSVKSSVPIVNGKVINKHHFNKNIELQIKDSKLHWFIRENPPFGEMKEVIVKDPITLITKLKMVFAFTGIDLWFDRKNNSDELKKIKPYERPDELCTYVDDKLVDAEQALIIRDMIYNEKLEQKIKFVQRETCGCNMIYCSNLVDMHIIDSKIETYGDVMKLFGPQYPDSVLLEIRLLNEKKIPKETKPCHGEPKKININFDKGTTYLAYGYER